MESWKQSECKERTYLKDERFESVLTLVIVECTQDETADEKDTTILHF